MSRPSASATAPAGAGGGASQRRLLLAGVAACGALAAIGAALAWRSRRRRQCGGGDAAAAPSPASEKEDEDARAALYAMPAYTQLSLSQAQELFDAFRPLAAAAAADASSSASPAPPRRFVVESVKELLGGLSNSNYRLAVRDLRRGGALRLYLLKVCEEKSVQEVRAQLAALALIKRISADERVPQSSGIFPRPCPIAYPYRVGLSAEREEEEEAAADAADAASDAASSSSHAPSVAASLARADAYMLHLPSLSSRALVLFQYLDGRNVRTPTPAVLQELALAQAQLHSVPLSLPGGRSFDFLPRTPFGMFAVREQFQLQVAHPSVAGRWDAHPFVAFMRPRLGELEQCELLGDQLPQGIMHSDLFLENVMFEKQGDKLLGMIDFEEMGVGPRVLDVTMTLVGCCYSSSSNALLLPLVHAFLHAYASHAPPLTSLERAHFLPFLRWSLCAIAYWRWQNFNVRIPLDADGVRPNPRRDAYLPMQQRVEALEEEGLRAELQRMVDDMPAGTGAKASH